jgi:Carboxypeptidase regulatory-like domain
MMKNKSTFIGTGWRLAVSLLLLAVAMPMTATAQETTSSIRGKVRDASGAPVAGATVVVRNMRTAVTYNYESNSSGTFFASNLPVGGPYQVTVNGQTTLEVANISLGDIYNLAVELPAGGAVEEIVVTGQAVKGVDVAAGPAATFNAYDIETSVNFNRDIVDVYSIDPRLNLDNEDDGFEINCGGKHPRFNSVTLDGISQNDRFGLNSNGYSTAVGMPFPFDAIEQVAVELAPFDVTYGGFSACNINAVTKSGSNEWEGNVFYEYTSDSLRGDTVFVRGQAQDLSTPAFDETKIGFSIGGPIIQDRLFVFAAYETAESPRFLARGPAGSGNGDVRDWLSQATYDQINNAASTLYGYDTGGSPTDGVQESDKYMVRLDWNINDSHNLAVIYNYFDGFQDRDSDGDSDEFEFANHFYKKGAESETTTVKLFSQWNDAFSTEFFYSQNTMNDSQVTVGPKDFADFQIDIGFNTVYLGADDSRQANALNTESDFIKLSGQYLLGDHVITAGFEREELTIFNQFVQHSNGGEYDFYNDSGFANNPASCAALDSQGRFDDPTCAISGLDRFLLGRPSQIYYGSGGGTNDPADAAALFSNTLNSLYLQDEFFFDQFGLTIVAGARYDWFESSDRPTYNQTFSDAVGIRNDANIDGLSLLMPRFGFTWEARDDLTIRGGIGLYSGGNPNVWISNAWSNDGLTNVQVRLRNFNGARSLFDGSIALSGQGRPGYDIPQELIDEVAAVTPADASDENLVLIDPSYKQPREWKTALGATYMLPWNDIQMDVDYLHTVQKKSAYYVDLSQEVIGQTTTGQPIYDYAPGMGEDNFMLTNSTFDGKSDLYSIQLQKDFDWGLDLSFGYAYTDAEDVSPMTSSVAGSNFDNLALNDVNNPRPGTSNYVVPHRFTLRASYARDFFGDNTTRFTMFAFSQEGQPQSYVMGSGDQEGNGRFGRHLLYVPTGASDPNVVFDPGFDQAAFFAWVNSEGLSPGLQPRNGQHASWSTRVDIGITQEFPAFVGDAKGRAFLKIYNVGNLLNDDWGPVKDAEFFSVQVVNSDIDSSGRYVFNSFTDRSIETVLENRSLYEIRLGIEIDF